MIRTALTSLIVASVIILTGCAAQQSTRSGFLGNYDAVSTTDPAGNSISFTKPGLSTSRYTRFMLGPVVFDTGKDASAKISNDEIAALKMDLEAAVRNSFEGRFEHSTEPGPDVLRLRFAITGVDKSNPQLNVALAILIVPLANGGATTEAEALDSMTGERLVAVVAHSTGSLLRGEFSGYFTEFGHARQHFMQQADAMRERLMQARN